MLLNNFFYIDSISHVDNRIVAQVSINVEHDILKGHFPEQAVVPGVCMLEMLKEVLQVANNKRYQLKSAPIIKFLTMFAPPQFTKAVFEIKQNSDEDYPLNISAELKLESNIFLKFKGSFIEKQ